MSNAETVRHYLSVRVQPDSPSVGRWNASAHCSCGEWDDNTDRADVQNLLTGIGYRFALHVGEQQA